jgi:Arm DNA-binding domain
MRGSVRQRGSTYTWYLFTPDPVTGQRRQHSKGGYRTKKECQAALNDALAALRVGTSSSRPSAPWRATSWTNGYRRCSRLASDPRPGSATSAT